MQFDPSPLVSPGELSRREAFTRLVAAIGRKLTAYVGGVRNVREVDRLQAGGSIDAEKREPFQAGAAGGRHPVREGAAGDRAVLADRSQSRTGRSRRCGFLREAAVNDIGADLLAAARNMAAQG